MASDDGLSAPLLDLSEDIHEPREEVSASNGAVGGAGAEECVAETEPPRAEGAARANVFSFDSILNAVFVVSFDTKHGNTLEWRLPKSMELNGLEFKAMASGFHHMDKDFVLFSYNDLFGISCFEKIAVDNVEERGVRLRSVGVINASYMALFTHQKFLEEEVRHQLKVPGDYTELKKYFSQLENIDKTMSPQSPVPSLSAVTPGQSVVPRLLPAHPAGCFADLCSSFGASIFALWRLVLLQQRILFVSKPPIGALCIRVYCAKMMSSRNVDNVMETNTRPLFYVNINDTDMLERCTEPFVACTSEVIFKTKRNLYDVIIEDQDFDVPNHLKSIAAVSHTDQDRFAQLERLRSRLASEGTTGDEELCIEFFEKLNNKLFNSLVTRSMTQDRRITPTVFKEIGLDPVSDATFVMELCDRYHIRVETQTPVCPCLSCL